MSLIIGQLEGAAGGGGAAAAAAIKTLSELGTYRSADHQGGTVYIRAENGLLRPAYSDGLGNWRWVSDDTVAYTDTPATYLRGLALQGLESEGTGVLPGVAGTDYNLHPDADFTYYAGKGLQIFRIGYLWERLQPTLNGPLDETYLGYLISCIDRAYARGRPTLLDCHNYGRRRALGTNGAVSLIGSAGVPVSALADMYTKLAARVKGRPGLFGYDIMNEPHTMLVPQSPLSYNPKLAGQPVQLIPNYKFAVDLSGWSANATYTRKTDPAVNGGLPFVEYNGVSGNFDNFTTSNDASSGMAVDPSSVYTISGTLTASFTGNYPQVQVNTGADDGAGHAFPGTTLGAMIFTSTPTETRWSVQFTTAADTKKVWIRFAGRGGTGRLRLMKLNITKDATVQPYRDYAFGGVVATSSLMYQACITAIRNAGDMNSWCVVESDDYAGLHSFTKNFGPDPDVNLGLIDPANRIMASFHYYFDAGRAGTYATAWTQALTDRMAGDILPALQWSQRKGQQVFVGEYGVPPGSTASDIAYQGMLNTFLGYLDTYKAHGTYYAGGVQFSSETTISPLSDYTVDRPQMPILQQHLG